MPQSVLDQTVVLRWNDAEGAHRLLTENAARVACLLLDPMPSRAGLIPPTAAFVDAVQDAARRHGILVVADEVLNFRQGFAGASPLHGIRPDLWTLGKIIGGGLPIGAIGGRAELMAVFDGSDGRPALPQGGTFSANPLSMVAGQASLAALDHAAFTRLDALGDRLRSGIAAAADRRDADWSVTGAASLFRLHTRRTAPAEYREAWQGPAETARVRALVRHFAEAGVILSAATSCLSTPMGTAEIDRVVQVFDEFIARPDVARGIAA